MFSKPKNTAILVILAFVVSVNGESPAMRIADANPAVVSAQAGETVNLLCSYPKPITSCNFRIPGDINEIKLNPAWQRNDNYKYFGKGLADGDCGITISRIDDLNHGLAFCRLDLNDGFADAVANISIVIAKAPQDPRIGIEETDYFEAGEDIDVTCTSIDGRPGANISWFLNEKPLGNGEIYLTESQTPESTLVTVESKLRLRLRPDDNNARLICRTEHVGFPDGFRSTSHQLTVRFHPVPLSTIHVGGLEIGSDAVIGPVTIHANPAPNVQWLIDGKVMSQGERNEKFIVNAPVSVGEGRFNASLQVLSLTLEDTTRSYLLRATNAIGTTDYNIKIGGSQEVAGTGLSIVTIIAITIISLFVLVVVALIVVARVTKRWCFAGDSMHPNGPDSEAQIAPEDDKTHEQYEPHEQPADEEPEPVTGNGDSVKATNGKAKGNTSV